VKTLLLQSIKKLDESDARKLLINVAVSTPLIYIDIWNALTHTQMLKVDEKMRKIQKQSRLPNLPAPQVQQAQQVKLAKKIQEQSHPPIRSAPQVE
jgi:hypothetical protein